ncbi:ABC transporter ATP-binding protein [Leadbettera azotonutricia]|uniref:Nitrate transport ATP-binding protein NrtD n=1 Tax=Leadbettera azotonutricia (strain ATCC BAA-888 / DSM 13862 / ZAS-9) TaxID=545695 RepID=F5YBU2_LEAAZ|nr:ABC transporter ATP-binding protein [Leadbettera azotonutricia]AEF81209.1 nitrate transport ATP-binding protein NrtD [Leadbettera azotonutricia ZAS-9]
MVELKGLFLNYPLPHREKAAVLHNANAEFADGAISAIIGPSGCGKTSLIKIMAGLLKPADGTVLIDGSPVRGVRKNTAVIFQDYGLLPWKTVRANAELPLRIKGLKGKGREGLDALLAEFGLDSFEKYYPRQLSGGMKQRLAIVRALAADPQLLLMDEPFSSLDALAREDAQDFLLSVKQERRLTIIMVTHSIEEAVFLADTVYVMSGKNPGTLGRSIDIPRNGASQARFRGAPEFLECCTLLRKALKEPA